MFQNFTTSLQPAVAIIACGNTKLDRVAPARDLYIGQLFKARKRYVESLNIPWYIFSAKYGIVQPGQMLEPYDKTLTNVVPAHRYQIGLSAVNRLASLLLDTGVAKYEPMPPGRIAMGFDRTCCIEIHGGQDYVFALAEGNHDRFVFRWPTKGLQIGEQMHYYATQR